VAFARTRSSGLQVSAGRRSRGGPPPAFWLLILVLGSAWIRILTPYGPVYPGQWLLIPIVAWALWRGPLASGSGTWERPPLLPLIAFALWVGVLAALRGQWPLLGALAVSSAGLAVWAYAAYRVGRGDAPMGAFVPAAILVLAATLAVGVLAWLAQMYWPAACVVFNCDPAAPLPFPFRGGWFSSAQYLLFLIFLVPPVGGSFLTSWREGGSGIQHWALTGIVGAAGLGLLAGMRWWGFILFAVGVLLLVQILASDRRPADRLLVRGLAFFMVFVPIAFYGLVPGYGTALLFQPGNARLIGVRHSLTSPVVLSSEHVVPVPIQVVNAGTVALRATPERPLHVKAMALFTPRSGGDSRLALSGEAPVEKDLGPGETLDVTVEVQLPAWINQGYLSWAAEDDGGRTIGVADGVHQGFRFINGDYSSLADGGDNTLSALAARARASAAPELAISSAAGSRRNLAEPVLGDAFDSLFFSPVWGQSAPQRFPGQVFDPGRPLLLLVLYQYGLVGLGLVLWFLANVFRQGVQLGFGRRAGAPLMWRLVPVSAVLLAVLGLISGEPGRFHSWWGCVLLAGFVQGVHERVFPSRGRAAPPRWLHGPLRVVAALLRTLGGLAFAVVQAARAIGRAGGRAGRGRLPARRAAPGRTYRGPRR
jgi:hypothetical protein